MTTEPTAAFTLSCHAVRSDVLPAKQVGASTPSPHARIPSCAPTCIGRGPRGSREDATRLSTIRDRANPNAAATPVFAPKPAVIVWNTVYVQALLQQLRAEGHVIEEADIGCLSPARYEHINPYGRYRIDVDQKLSTALRPLRAPDSGAP